MPELTDKQLKFCHEYMVDLNATQATIRAGYSEDTAAEQGSRLLTNVKVLEYISELKRSTANKLEITKERVLKEYARLAFSDLRKYYSEDGKLLNPKDLDDDAAAALAGIEVFEEIEQQRNGEKKHIGDTKKIKTYNKLQALDSLGKHLGLFEEDNKQRNPAMDLSKLSAEEKYQLLLLMRKTQPDGPNSGTMGSVAGL